MIHASFGVNEVGNLTLNGADTVELAKQYGTPLYVFSEDDIRENCRHFVEALGAFYDGNGQILYASKAFCCKEMYRIMKEESMGIDVVSGGELYTALSVDFPVERIFFHGNNKTDAELKLAIQAGVGHIVVDNLEEMHRLNDFASAANRVMHIFLRVKPGIDAHTHSFIRTGQIDSKFGFALETGEAMAAAKEALSLSHLSLDGLHCHIGSQIFDTEPFALAADVMLRLMDKLRAETGVTLEGLNLGGGFGIRYQESDRPGVYRDSIEIMAAALRAAAKELDFPLPKLYLEPGRSIVGAASATLYKVGSVKEIPGIRTYVAVDGGMTDNPRYALYQAPYEIVIANKAREERDFVATVAGKCCESGDLIQENAAMQHAEPGDTLAVLATGPYNDSMASNYNRIPRPAAVMIRSGNARLIRRRESYEDLVKNDL